VQSSAIAGGSRLPTPGGGRGPATDAIATTRVGEIMPRLKGIVLTSALAAVLSLASFAAVAPGAAVAGSGGRPVHGGTLVLAREEDAISFDPIVPTDNGSIWTMLLIYEQLVRPNPQGTGVEPDLAQSWTISPDGKTYTFHLRPGVTFTNGMPVTSADVQWSLARAFKSANWSFLFPGKIAIDTPNVDTVVFHLSTPDSAFLAKLGLFSCSILPEKVYAHAPESAFDHPIGSGPFELQSWQQGKQEVLVANPHYWDKPYPYLSKVVLENVPDDNTRVLLARSGQADVVTEIPYSQVAALEHVPSLTVKTYAVGRVDMMLMNTKVKPFNDPKVRLAINYAIDREALIRTILYGVGARANTFLPPMLYHCPPAVCQGYDQNLALAKKYMAESSVPHGFTTTLQYQAGLQNDQEAAVIIKQELAQIGINVRILPVDIGTLLSNNTAGKYQLMKLYMTTDIIDPSELTQFAGVGNGGDFAMWTFWNNPELDRLATQVNTLTSGSQRQSIYYRIQNIFNQAPPVADLYYPPAVAAYQKWVHGFRILETSNYQLWKVWVSPH
jgi:peptide/nickel transport system substrate-binding protein